jgi:hypothetical protein
MRPWWNGCLADETYSFVETQLIPDGPFVRYQVYMTQVPS